MINRAANMAEHSFFAGTGRQDQHACAQLHMPVQVCMHDQVHRLPCVSEASEQPFMRLTGTARPVE